MADNTIKIIKTDSGAFRAVLQHGGVAISCGNDSADVVNDTTRNSIRLIADAVDKGWFRDDAYSLSVLGSVHSTTDGHADAKHLTVNVKPGPKRKHLYVLPDNKESTLSDDATLNTSRPPAK